MARKPWSELSDSYRSRLERQGITEQMHAAGVDLRAARGHGRAVAEDRQRRERGVEPRRPPPEPEPWSRDQLPPAAARHAAIRDAIDRGELPQHLADGWEGGSLNDVTLYGLWDAGAPPPEQWVSVTFDPRDLVYIITDVRGAEWTIDGPDHPDPFWSSWEWFALVSDPDARDVRSGAASGE